jgi:hypothetical protein
MMPVDSQFNPPTVDREARSGDRFATANAARVIETAVYSFTFVP